MNDDEILTKRLSDWKPETNIKLQKAFGKFVEEAGELLEVSNEFLKSKETSVVVSFENELADCKAVISMIEYVASDLIDVSHPDVSYFFRTVSELRTKEEVLVHLAATIGITLSIIGRCQIQGLSGRDPESGTPNSSMLSSKLAYCRSFLGYIPSLFNLDKPRIEKRTQAKIDSKLPWVMGTATDLLPST